jgi:hypothetical protein
MKRSFAALCGNILLFFSALGWSSELAAPPEESLSGEWSRLNAPPGGTPSASEHEIVHFWVEAKAWSGHYDKYPEPALGFSNPPDGTVGVFNGAVAINFVCQPTFPFYPCQDVVQVVEGTMRYSPTGRPPYEVHQQNIVVRQDNGHEVMWQYFVSPGNFACPWYRDSRRLLRPITRRVVGTVFIKYGRSRSDCRGDTIYSCRVSSPRPELAKRLS